MSSPRWRLGGGRSAAEAAQYTALLRSLSLFHLRPTGASAPGFDRWLMFVPVGRVLGPPRTTRLNGRCKADTKSPIGFSWAVQPRFKHWQIEDNPPYLSAAAPDPPFQRGSRHRLWVNPVCWDSWSFAPSACHMRYALGQKQAPRSSPAHKKAAPSSEGAASNCEPNRLKRS